MITRGLTYDEYAALPGTRWSSLKRLDVSPLHYHYALTAPNEPTDAMTFGSAVHCAVLEPDSFPLRYELWDGGTRRGKEWDAFVAMHADKTILKESDYARCLAVRDAIHAKPEAARLLIGESEVSCEWTDAGTGIACKARFDHVSASGLVDIKTTASIDQHKFERTSADFLYHGAAAFYRRGFEACNGGAFDTPFRIIAVETTAPYDVGVFRIPDHVLLAGDQLVTRLLADLAGCTERDEWPGRYSGEVELGLPPWMLEDDDGIGGLFGGSTDA